MPIPRYAHWSSVRSGTFRYVAVVRLSQRGPPAFPCIVFALMTAYCATVFEISGGSSILLRMAPREEQSSDSGWRFLRRIPTEHGAETYVVTHPALDGLEVHVEIDADATTVGLGLVAPADHYRPQSIDGETSRLLPPGGISTRRLRTVQWNAAERFVRRTVAPKARTLDLTYADDRFTEGAGPGSPVSQRAAERLEALQGRPVDREKLKSLLELCSRYVDLVGSDSPSPVKLLADEQYKSPSHIRNLMYDARRRGLFANAPTSSTGGKRGGKAGGQLTVEGAALLAQLRKETSP